MKKRPSHLLHSTNTHDRKHNKKRPQESNCTVWQEKMAYLNNKTANANTVNGNGASCPAPANATLGDLPLYEDQIVASYVNKGASERPFLLDNVWDLQRVLDWLFYVGTDEKVEVEWSQQQQQGPAVAAAAVDAAFSLSDKVLRRDVFGENRRLFNVDAARVGTTGISLGGLHSSLLGVVEQRRIAVLAPAIGVPTFAWVSCSFVFFFISLFSFFLFTLFEFFNFINNETKNVQGAGHGDEWKPRAYSIPKVFLVSFQKKKKTFFL